MANDKDDGVKIGSPQDMQARYDHIAARGHAAREKPSKERSDEDWADIEAHRATFGLVTKDWKKDYDELDKRSAGKKKRVLYDNPRSPKSKED